jgi:hypothetical protein
MYSKSFVRGTCDLSEIVLKHANIFASLLQPSDRVFDATGTSALGTQANPVFPKLNKLEHVGTKRYKYGSGKPNEMALGSCWNNSDFHKLRGQPALSGHFCVPKCFPLMNAGRFWGIAISQIKKSNASAMRFIRGCKDFSISISRIMAYNSHKV